MQRLCMLLLFSTLLLPDTLLSQVVTGRVSASAYSWERQDDTLGGKTQHIRGYGGLQLDVASGIFSFHTSMQGTTDFRAKMDENDPALRLYNAYLSAKAGVMDVKLGRMPVFAGVSYGSIDGGQIKVNPSEKVEVMVYGGGLTPPSQRTDFFQHFDKNWQAGGQVLFFLMPNARIGVSYMNRHRETTPYSSFRPDQFNNQVLTLIDYGTRANQYASVNGTWSNKDLWLFGRVDYDFNFERLSRAEVSGTYQATPKLGYSLNLAFREPTISYNSYFQIFETGANAEAVAGVDYQIHPLATLQGRVSAVVHEDATSWSLSLGAVNRYASIMYTKDMSYDGSLDAFNIDLTYPVWEGRIVPHVGAMYSNYALADNLEKTSATAIIAGAMFRPMRTLSLDVQGQYINNKLYSSDTRVLVRLNYWFSNAFGLANRREGK